MTQEKMSPLHARMIDDMPRMRRRDAHYRDVQVWRSSPFSRSTKETSRVTKCQSIPSTALRLPLPNGPSNLVRSYRKCRPMGASRIRFRLHPSQILQW